MMKYLWSIILKYLQEQQTYFFFKEEQQTYEFKIQSFYINPYLKNVEVKILSLQNIWVDFQDKHHILYSNLLNKETLM